MMNPVTDNPYAVLTLIAAPAILTNASSVLALGTSNRFARAVDRQRQLSRMLEDAGKLDDDTRENLRRQLRITERRPHLLIGALMRFYTSLGSFAASALISLLGAVFVPLGYRVAGIVVVCLALVAGIMGVGGLVWGCILLIRETRLTIKALHEEAMLGLLLSQDPDATPTTRPADKDDGADPMRDRIDDALR